jgi:hypothetical protein
MDQFELPGEISALVAARNGLRHRYRSSGLKFTLDGNLVGDLGEAIAAEIFGVRLSAARGLKGIDGYALDGRSVQVKATGTGRGAAFTPVETHADHLLFFCFDLEALKARLLFNGPERIIRRFLPDVWVGQHKVSRSNILAADKLVSAEQRLVPAI